MFPNITERVLCYMNSVHKLTKNELKLFACATMLLDHIGIALFPKLILLRIIGRLAFPIFAYSIYEGYKYTYKKRSYFFEILGLGIICAVAYYLYEKVIFGNVLITFSLSICVLYCIHFLKAALLSTNVKPTRVVTGFLLTVGSLTGTVLICHFITVDYGVLGVLLPVFVELFDLDGLPLSGALENPIQKKALSMFGFSLGLLLLSFQMGGIQFFSLLSLIPLALYGGKKGTHDMKYFFYLFYPLHLGAIGVVSALFA